MARIAQIRVEITLFDFFFWWLSGMEGWMGALHWVAETLALQRLAIPADSRAKGLGSQFMRVDEETMKAGTMAVENAIVVDFKAIKKCEEIQAAVVHPQLKAEGTRHGLLLSFAKNHSNPNVSSLLEAVPAFQPSSFGMNVRLFPERATDSNWRAHWTAQGASECAEPILRNRSEGGVPFVGRRNRYNPDRIRILWRFLFRQLKNLAYNKAIHLGCARGESVRRRRALWRNAGCSQHTQAMRSNRAEAPSN